MEAPSRHKSRLLREMSRDLNHSIASSTGSNHGTVSTDSTLTDFNPEKDDAVMSTRQLDNDTSNTNPKLPKLRDTAKKYGRWAPRQPEFVINTSALDKAFPDFTQGSIDDALDTESIEVGRGAKTRQRGASRNPRFDYSDNFDSPIVVGEYKVLRSPPRGHDEEMDPMIKDIKRSSVQKTTISQHRNLSQKENLPPSAQKSATGSPYVSNASLASGGQRRTLAELHAYVADESNGSISLDPRAAHRNFQAKSTRFSSQSKAQQLTTLSKKQQLEDVSAAKFRAASNTTPSRGQGKSFQVVNTGASNTPNPTQQSFILPAATEFSQLVSAETGAAGIPVIVRGGMVQARTLNRFSGKFDDVDGIEVPTEEEDIYLSVELLKSKVAQLETEKADSEKIVNDLKRDNFQLQTKMKEFERRRRSDSALGIADGGSDNDRDRNVIAEKASKYHPICPYASLTSLELQAHAASLQSLLDESRHKASSQELRLKTNTAERDHAVKQLAQAEGLLEQLRAENDDLKEENESLRLQLKEYTEEDEMDTNGWRVGERALKQEVASLKTKLSQLGSEIEENALNWGRKESSLKRKIRRQLEILGEVQEATQEIRNNTLELNIMAASRKASKSTRPVKSKRKASVENGSTANNRLAGKTDKSRPAELSVRPKSHQSTHEELQEPQSVDKSINAEESYNEESTAETTVHRSKVETVNQDGSTLDGSEYASIVGPDFMANLRQLLRVSRTMKRETETAPAAIQDTTNYTAQSVRSAASSQALSLKVPVGILKNNRTVNQDEFDLTGRLSVRSSKHHEHAENEHNSASTVLHRRRHSDSAVNAPLRGRRTDMDDMTSEFIIPDIASTIYNRVTEYPVLSTNARHILDGLCKHDGKNCTVCSRVVSFDAKSELKSKVHVPKPIPVSDRMPVPAPYEEEPTTRPAVQPGLALAIVIKGLKDEVAHLKAELSRVQAAYNKHDSSLGMRQRKALKKHLDELLKAIDVKSDQIYALYDVLEGQKLSGQQMSEEDIEVTLLSIGIDPNEFAKTSKKDANKKTQEQNDNGAGNDDEDDDSELDLPWEGIDDTTTGSIVGKRRPTFA